jgi:hypothetical protein
MALRMTSAETSESAGDGGTTDALAVGGADALAVGVAAEGADVLSSVTPPHHSSFSMGAAEVPLIP